MFSYTIEESYYAIEDKRNRNRGVDKATTVDPIALDVFLYGLGGIRV
ncbi:hypothetical protein Slin15195_G129390 [Septoria linicola]|uniref:Uncharacterized protein n=1 Tax=Septoria linicola TaxID=215465 RepID=A0A9Q9B7C5_9PEZI|nr:hypothetical protein Slin15195_G129390 [Septoria linicola]